VDEFVIGGGQDALALAFGRKLRLQVDLDNFACRHRPARPADQRPAFTGWAVPAKPRAGPVMPPREVPERITSD
jgi:hypothetical protein